MRFGVHASATLLQVVLLKYLGILRIEDDLHGLPILPRQVVYKLWIVIIVLLRLHFAECSSENAFKQLSNRRLDHGRVPRTVRLLEDVHHWIEQVLVNDHHDVALVFGAQEGLVELDDLDVEEFGVEAGELSHCLDHVVLDHEKLKRIAMLSRDLVQDLHDEIRGVLQMSKEIVPNTLILIASLAALPLLLRELFQELNEALDHILVEGLFVWQLIEGRLLAVEQ